MFRTNRWVSVLTLVLVLAAPLKGYAAGPVLAPDVQRILDRGKLIVAMYHKDTFPFYMRDNDGKLTGFDVGLIRGFAERLGVTIKFNRDAENFEEVVNIVARHEADVAVSKLSRTFKRAKRIRFTTPTIVLREALLINRLTLAKQARKHRTTAEAIRKLTGPVGVIKNSSYEGFARERFTRAKVMGYPSWQEVINALIHGKVMVAYRDEVEIKKIVQHRPEIALHFKSVVLKDTRDPKGMAVAWDSTHLLALLNHYLEPFDPNLTAETLLNRFKK